MRRERKVYSGIYSYRDAEGQALSRGGWRGDEDVLPGLNRLEGHALVAEQPRVRAVLAANGAHQARIDLVDDRVIGMAETGS